MEAAAEREDFEEAARLRDRLFNIERTLEKQRITQTTTTDQDVIGLARQGSAVDLQILFVRGGLLIGRKDALGIDPAAPLPTLTRRVAMLLPTYNEDPYRVLARLRAVYESVEDTGRGSHFDWFVLSDSTDPAIWIAEEKVFLRLRAIAR